jgi:hypothetical protein
MGSADQLASHVVERLADGAGGGFESIPAD